MFDINQNVISDSLVFMLHAYYSCNYEKFAFWKEQFDRAVKVEMEKCNCNKVILN